MFEVQLEEEQQVAIRHATAAHTVNQAGRVISFDLLGKRGRLGNSLYQLASTIGIAERIGESVRFNADWIHRPYFSVPDEFFGEAGGVPAGDVCVQGLPPGPVTDWRREFLQDFDLFASVLPKIRRYLAPSPLAQGILDDAAGEFEALAKPVLSIHVRRGDNVIDAGVPDKHLYWPVPPLSYYKTAAAAFSGHASVAVFSDDIAWCIANIEADYYHHGVGRPKEHESNYLTAPVLDWIDLQLMARCHGGHVLSNSTFGWWGALLAGEETAVYPWPIVGPKLAQLDLSIALPSIWTRLDYSC